MVHNALDIDNQYVSCRQPQFTAQVVRHTLHILEIHFPDRSLHTRRSSQLHFSYSLILINRRSFEPSVKLYSEWYAVADEEKLNWKTCYENDLSSFISIIFFCQRTIFKLKYSAKIKTNVIIIFSKNCEQYKLQREQWSILSTLLYTTLVCLFFTLSPHLKIKA